MDYEIARVLAANVGAAAGVASGKGVAESSAAPSTPRKAIAYGRIAGDFDLDSLVQRVYTGEDNDILTVETDAKLLAARRTFGRVAVLGDPAANEPAGLNKLFTLSVAASGPGSTLVLADLDKRKAPGSGVPESFPPDIRWEAM